MDNTNALNSFYKMLKVLRRRKLVFLIPFILTMPAIIAGGTFLPKLYRASTTILVEPQKIPSEYVKSIITVPIEQRLKTITQQVMSRSRLLKIVREMNMADGNNDPQALENMIDEMQKNIEIEAGGTSFFQIAYTGRDPRMVMLVTNKIAGLFIEENLRVSERQVKTTTKFISEELEKVQQQLEDQEQKLQEFKQQHMGELPSQEEANLRALDRLQLQLQNNSQALHEAEEKEMLLQKQLLEEKPFKTVGEGQQNPLLSNLLQLKEELEALKARYSDEWPRIKQIKDEIADLEGKLKEIKLADNPLALETTIDNPIYKNLKQSLEATKRRVAALKKDKNNLLKEIAVYRKKVEMIPETEQQLISLTRDYDMTKNKYESLLNKKLEANLAESLEIKQKGETFKILDAAEIPLIPYKPNLFKIIAIGVGVGLVLGGGTAWLAESCDSSIREIDDAENCFGVQVIGIISNIMTPIDIKRKRRKTYVLVVGLILYAVAISLIIKHRDPIKEYLLSVSSRLNAYSIFQRG
jgi:succinoglycan biosynthesis transport protein ExoP